MTFITSQVDLQRSTHVEAERRVPAMDLTEQRSAGFSSIGHVNGIRRTETITLLDGFIEERQGRLTSMRERPANYRNLAFESCLIDRVEHANNIMAITQERCILLARHGRTALVSVQVNP